MTPGCEKADRNATFLVDSNHCPLTKSVTLNFTSFALPLSKLFCWFLLFQYSPKLGFLSQRNLYLHISETYIRTRPKERATFPINNSIELDLVIFLTVHLLANCTSASASWNDRKLVLTAVSTFFNVLITLSTWSLPRHAPVAIKCSLIFCKEQNSANLGPVKLLPWSATIRIWTPNNEIKDFNAITEVAALNVKVWYR